MSKYNVGVIGRGFVGGAILSHLSNSEDVRVLSYDISDDMDADQGYQAIALNCDIIYLCLPTPPSKDGSCFTGIVEEALALLSHHVSDKLPIVLIKSTLVPQTITSLQDKFKNIIIASNPEFLTERTAEKDVVATTKHLIGLPDHKNNPIKVLLERFFKDVWPKSTCIFMSTTEAELVKYITNSFFSVKVMFANTIYKLCDELSVDYKEFILKALEADQRLGSLHWEGPGHDGKLGFGGKCFPKDLSGMVEFLESKGVDSSLLKIAQDMNNKLRD